MTKTIATGMTMAKTIATTIAAGAMADGPAPASARRLLRAGIWLGLALSALYLSGTALAFQLGYTTAPMTQARAVRAPMTQAPMARTAVGTMDSVRIWSWSGADQEKAELFKKPTPANPGDEIACLALNIYHESRGEPEEGKLAVGHVVMNRIASRRFPGTVCGVIRQGGELRRYRCQFSWWCDGRSDKPRNEREWKKSGEMALAIYWGRTDDPTAGALWYHADYVKPDWRNDFRRGRKIGQHIFYHQPKAAWPTATQLASRVLRN